MSRFEIYTEQELEIICKKLLSDCFLIIHLKSNSFSIILEFISNLEPKIIKFKCNGISELKFNKDSNENPYYTILEVSSKIIDGKWALYLAPEIALSIICLDLFVEITNRTE